MSGQVAACEYCEPEPSGRYIENCKKYDPHGYGTAEQVMDAIREEMGK